MTPLGRTCRRRRWQQISSVRVSTSIVSTHRSIHSPSRIFPLAGSSQVPRRWSARMRIHRPEKENELASTTDRRQVAEHRSACRQFAHRVTALVARPTSHGYSLCCAGPRHPRVRDREPTQLRSSRRTGHRSAKSAHVDYRMLRRYRCVTTRAATSDHAGLRPPTTRFLNMITPHSDPAACHVRPPLPAEQ